MKKNRKNNFRLLLLALLLVVTVGYATLNSSLSISGTANVNNPTWNIHFNAPSVTNGSVSGTNVTKAATLDSATSISYSVTLENPGDFYEFTFEVENEGSIDGMITGLTAELNDEVLTTLPPYLSYSVSYSDGGPVIIGQKLDAGDIETFKVRVAYRTDINEDDLPESEQTLNFKVGIDYGQKDSTAVAVSH